MSKIAMITGATAGIGEACAELFAAEKFNLILVARRKERLEALSEKLETSFGIQTVTIVLDVREKDAVKCRFESLAESWKNIDVLINNAGLSLGLEPIQDGSIDDWDAMIDTNVKGLLYVTKQVSQWMVQRKKGHIINLGSVAGREVYPNGNVYCASKHAVDALSKAMRIDLLPYGIKVTAVDPGPAETEFAEVRFKGDKERAKKVYHGYEPLRAIDIAEAIWFAVSRPAHVNVNDLLLMPAAQATATIIQRK